MSTPDELRQIETIRDWFAQRGFTLVFEHDGTVWVALALRTDKRVGPEAFEGLGETRLEAAEDAQRRALPHYTVSVTATLPVESTAPVSSAPPRTQTRELEGSITPTGELHLEVLRGVELDLPRPKLARLEEIATDYGWRLAFVREPDETIRWLVASEDGEVLKSGKAQTPIDGLLEAIIDLYPPSAEAAR